MNQLARMKDGLVLLVILATLSGCTSAEVKAVRGMPIKKIDLLQVKDGGYLGDFSYGGFTYEVKVTIASHQLKDIVLLKNRTTKHAKMAEGVVKSILDQQRNDVDAVSGATTTSKALLKAIENALAKGL
jgi:uncharacterized protein with FMN-binding domain